MPNIHLPRRKPKSGNSNKVTVQSVDGTLRKLSEEGLLLQLTPRRVLQFKLVDNTEFRGKDGKPIHAIRFASPRRSSDGRCQSRR